MAFTNRNGSQEVECNRYKNRRPGKLSLNGSYSYDVSFHQPQRSPSTQDAVAILSKMHQRVSDDGYYLPTPSTPTTAKSFTFNSMNRKLPVTSPLTPSCAYYQNPAPKFVYPEDLMPPTSLFTNSIANNMMAEESIDEKPTKPRSHDIASILSLHEEASYDLFDNVCTTDSLPTITFPHDYYSCNTYNPIDYNYRPADDLMPMQPPSLMSMQPPVSMPAPPNKSEHFVRPHAIDIKKETTATEPLPATKTSNPLPRDAPSMMHVTKPQQCHICHKGFSHKSSLKVHLRTHTGVRPYTCQFCQKSFTDNSTYVKHVRIHTQEKPYKCPTCDKSFSQSGNLKRHQKIHK